MIRPEQMSRVSVTGSKQVLETVIEATHDLNLFHITDYDGSWDGFDPGRSVQGAETAADKLVTVRSLKSILNVDDADAGPTRIVTDEEISEELESIRTTVNQLDDRRQELRQELREIEDRIEAAEPFIELGVDLDLLTGYDTLQVAIGRGDQQSVERAIDSADSLSTYEIFTGSDVLAIFARPTDAASDTALTDVLVGTEFVSVDLPTPITTETDTVTASGDNTVFDSDTKQLSPKEYVRNLEQRRQQLEQKFQEIEEELENERADTAGFLLAAEEKLAIDAEKAEAPLSFATTANAFIAEGWIPSSRYDELRQALAEAVGDHAQVDEIERATFSASGDDHVREDIPAGSGGGGNAGAPAPTAADGGDIDSDARADGGTAVVMDDDEPPTVQDNPGAVKPFEILVQAVNRPSYYEFDPTIILFLTFPAFFGFMIGDLGYGLIYTVIGYFLYTSSRFTDRPAFRSMGGITITAGIFTIIFGILYGEVFGLHLVATYLWEGVVGLSHAPIEKGLSPAGIEWARGWLVVSVLVGVVHLNIAWIFGLFEDIELHGAKDAFLENGSWLLMMNGFWIWVFSDALRPVAPEFIYTTFSAEGVLPLGFNGFPAMEVFTIPGMGAITVPLAIFVLGLVLLAVGEPVEAIEFLNILVNVLSYTRLAAVLLAKAAMAFTVNLLFFGVYVTNAGDGAEWHFGLEKMPQVGEVYHGHEVTDVMFGGLIHGDAATILIGLVVLILGHILVLALGVTSAGLQAVRLEYVEFFNKFYDGGGREYSPFGYEREFTTED
ncbi:V-type ATP synthase subunit I [Haloquadratum walsbyi]|uniref:A-type ATP synthase subunit I n=1 Tax=Haloquadratum walsbyi J07HQW2 TaxID=1238425 RepID=U1NEX6_9EURY|nr:V-type ATPase 116kDa subunit family protein [Haloquadratum walsbyi]ERG95323.1 MAG: archaeal/vacuolar-type H+-ATPase subunit I [Haloquadratum walsbyi J07HQW2]